MMIKVTGKVSPKLDVSLDPASVTETADRTALEILERRVSK